MDRSECAIRMSVILRAEGPELVFTWALRFSRSALVTRLPAATAAVAAVVPVSHVRRDTPAFSWDIAILLKRERSLGAANPSNLNTTLRFTQAN